MSNTRSFSGHDSSSGVWKGIYTEGTCEFQYGFRVGRYVEGSGSYVKRSIEESSSKYVPSIFADFKSAFDYLSLESVLGG